MSDIAGESEVGVLRDRQEYSDTGPIANVDRWATYLVNSAWNQRGYISFCAEYLREGVGKGCRSLDGHEV